MKIFVLLLLPFISLVQPKIDQKVSLLNGKVEIMAPKELASMTDEMWKIKYGTMQRPALALSDKAIEVNLIAQYTNQNWEDDKLSEYKDFRIANLKKTRNDVVFLQDGVKDVSGKKVGFIKFMSQAVGAKIFNYYFFIVVDDKVLMFTFNCIEKLKDVWEKQTDQMVESLIVK